MNAVAPNLQALIGEIVGSKLIAHAGGLTNLSKYPASTIQILGAEKALFRALKTKGKTPKYGLIFNSTFIGRAGLKNKGKISRYLANKCAIASRVDCFSEAPTAKFGDSLKMQVEERLKFLASGVKPRKNKDAMSEVLAELKADGLFYGDKVKVTKVADSGDEDNGDADVPEKKRDKKSKDKKDKKQRKPKEEETLEEDSEVEQAKKSKKRVKA
jgi:nucleolar protein 56